MRAARHARRASIAGEPVLALDPRARPPVVTGPAAASARTDGSRRFATAVSHGKFVSLSAARA